MITPIGGEYLGATRVEFGHSNRVLHRLGSTVREEHFGGTIEGMIQNQFCSTVTHFVAVLWRDRAKSRRLGLNGANDTGVLMTNVGVHQL